MQLNCNKAYDNFEKNKNCQINFRVIGYIIGADKNQESPKIVRRENAVEVKIPREHVILGDIPEHMQVSGNVPFYRS